MIGKDTIKKFNEFRLAASKDALGKPGFPVSSRTDNGIAFVHSSSTDIYKVITFINTSLRAINFITDMGILLNTKALAEDTANKILDKAFDYMLKLRDGEANGKNLMGIGNINSTSACNLASSILTDLFKITSSLYSTHSKRINIDAPLLLAFEKNMPGSKALLASNIHLTNPVPFYKLVRARAAIEKDDDISWELLIKKLEAYPQVQKLLVMK